MLLHPFIPSSSDEPSSVSGLLETPDYEIDDSLTTTGGNMTSPVLKVSLQSRCRQLLRLQHARRKILLSRRQYSGPSRKRIGRDQWTRGPQPRAQQAMSFKMYVHAPVPDELGRDSQEARLPTFMPSFLHQTPPASSGNVDINIEYSVSRAAGDHEPFAWAQVRALLSARRSNTSTS